MYKQLDKECRMPQCLIAGYAPAEGVGGSGEEGWGSEELGPKGVRREGQFYIGEDCMANVCVT